MKVLNRVLGAAMIAALSASCGQGAAPTTNETHAARSGDPVLGQELVEQLGLEPLEGPVVRGCNWGVEIRDGVAYCLDEVVTSSEEAFVLSTMIKGNVPTAAELELFRLSNEVSDLPNAEHMDAEHRAVLERIVELMMEVDATS
jgi:hypothetical protein